jgi:hypothetical protein
MYNVLKRKQAVEENKYECVREMINIQINMSLKQQRQQLVQLVM